MPTLIAATSSRTGEPDSAPDFSSVPTASVTAMKAPVIAAVRVPPSAWMTSQSTQIVRSASFGISTTARSDPSLPAALQERRHLLLDRGRAEHLGVAEGDGHRAFGMAEIVADDRDGPQLVGPPAVMTRND